MPPRTDGPWKLEDLVLESRRVLLEGGEAEGDSRRVRWLPNKRLVRYYTTLGLIDRPLELRGRTAYYGPRHLLQLVAIKRRQLAGHSLDQIQRELAGLDDDSLRRIAHPPRPEAAAPLDAPEGGPAEAPDSPDPAPAPAEPPAPPQRPDFWQRPPAPPLAPAVARPPADSPAAAAVPDPAPGHPAAERPEPAPAPLARLVGLSLGPSSQLLLAAPLAERIDPERLRELTRPLLDYLESLRGKDEHV